MTYKYKAVSDGVLSNPYRRVRKGETIIFTEPLEQPSKWLIPHEEYKPEPDLPLIPHMGFEKRTVAHASTTPHSDLGSDQYKGGMDDLKRAEAIQDGLIEPVLKEVKPGKFMGEVAPVAPMPAPAPVQNTPVPLVRAPAGAEIVTPQEVRPHPVAPVAVQETSGEGTGSQNVLG